MIQSKLPISFLNNFDIYSIKKPINSRIEPDFIYSLFDNESDVIEYNTYLRYESDEADKVLGISENNALNNKRVFIQSLSKEMASSKENI